MQIFCPLKSPGVWTDEVTVISSNICELVMCGVKRSGRAKTIISSLLFLALVVATGGKAAPDPRTRVFEGAWFQVAYPANFLAFPSLKSTTAERFDSAFFRSPDGAVEFYVFAPQWGGSPSDIALDPEHEVVVAEEKTVDQAGQITTHRTIAAKSRSYQRSYQITEEPNGPSIWIVGVKYLDADMLATHRQAYLDFKRSLKLWAD